MTVLTYSSDLILTAKQTRLAAMKLAVLSTAAKNEAIEAIAVALESAQNEIIQAKIYIHKKKNINKTSNC